MEMANLEPIHKLDDNQNVKNYRPVSLLPIFRRSYIQWNLLFFIENNSIFRNQSRFKQRESCANQLFAITHDIYLFQGQGYEVRGVFLRISKTFDKVWDKGLIKTLT